MNMKNQYHIESCDKVFKIISPKGDFVQAFLNINSAIDKMFELNYKYFGNRFAGFSKDELEVLEIALETYIAKYTYKNSSAENLYVALAKYQDLRKEFQSAIRHN